MDEVETTHIMETECNKKNVLIIDEKIISNITMLLLYEQSKRVVIFKEWTRKAATA